MAARHRKTVPAWNSHAARPPRTLRARGCQGDHWRRLRLLKRLLPLGGRLNQMHGSPALVVEVRPPDGQARQSLGERGQMERC